MALITTASSEPVIAVREWIAQRQNLFLTGVYSADRWPRKAALFAQCSPEWGCCSKHALEPPPHIYGTCGIHAIKAVCVHDGLFPDQVVFGRSHTHHFVVHRGRLFSPEHEGNITIVGLVALWGRVLVGDNNVYRGEHAYPLALFDYPGATSMATAYGIVTLPCPRSVSELQELIESVRTNLLIPIKRLEEEGP